MIAIAAISGLRKTAAVQAGELERAHVHGVAAQASAALSVATACATAARAAGVFASGFSITKS